MLVPEIPNANKVRVGLSTAPCYCKRGNTPYKKQTNNKNFRLWIAFPRKGL
jgi:hypothetical protein